LDAARDSDDDYFAYDAQGPVTEAKGISVLVRDLAQCRAVVDWVAERKLRRGAAAQDEALFEDITVDEVVLDFLEVRGLEAAVAMLRTAPGLTVVVATPRISLPGEDGVLERLAGVGADAMLVRAAGQLEWLAKQPRGAAPTRVRGDFSLNAANALAAAELLAAFDLERLTPSHDLSGEAQAKLASALGARGAARLELVAHQHLPIFHTSHCVFARHLSAGSDYRDCGHVCEKHAVHLRDDAGADHAVVADMGCRNTVFNAQAQSAAPFLASWLDAGVRRFRIEFVDDDAGVVRNILEAYDEQFQARGQAPEPLWSLLAVVPDRHGRPQGVDVGSLRSNKERKSGSLA